MIDAAEGAAEKPRASRLLLPPEAGGAASETRAKVEPGAGPRKPDKLAQREIAHDQSAATASRQVLDSSPASIRKLRRRTARRSIQRRRGAPQKVAARQPVGAPVRARTRRRPVAGQGQRARRPHQQRRRAAFVKAALAGGGRGGGAGARAAGGGGLNLLPWPKVDFAKFGEVEVKPLSRIQKISGANLARNWAMIPHVTQHDDADITELEALRVALNEENEKAGISSSPCSPSS